MAAEDHFLGQSLVGVIEIQTELPVAVALKLTVHVVQ